MDQHNVTVASLCRQVAAFHQSKTKYRIFHASTNSTRPSNRSHINTLDTSSLNHVIDVDVKKRVCLVESNVPMDALITATLIHSLVPPVVPEFPGITVGGAFSGTAGESSSFKYGFFDRAVNWFEMILATGEVVIASETQRHDLFYGSAGTFGTLGTTTLFEIRLISAKTHVELQYIPVRDISDAQKVMEQVAHRTGIDFLDGIMYGPTRGCVMAGKMVVAEKLGRAKCKESEAVTFTKPWDQWFYLHAESRLELSMSESMPAKDLIPLTDYLFRYDRGAFWTGKYAYWYFCTPFNRYTRWLLDTLMHTRILYHALHRSGLMHKFIIQDMAVPNSKMKEFSDWLDNELDIYPRWLCPLRQNESVSMHPHSAISWGSIQTNGEALLNVGVWGWCPAEHVTTNRRIEKKLKSLKGMKWLYAQCYYTESEFWSIYDRDWYDALRMKYKAENLPSVYEKVCTKLDLKQDVTSGIWSIWPLTGVYGLLSAIKGGDYLRK